MAITIRSLISALVLGFSALLGRSDAFACRDCPFPLFIEQGRWLMPSRVVEVRMSESFTQKNSVRTRLEVLSTNGQVLAFGYKQSKKDENDIQVRLFEVTGSGTWMAYIHFPNPRQRNQIRIRLRCLTVGQCMLSEEDFN